MCRETGYSTEGAELHQLRSDCFHFLKSPVYMNELLIFFSSAFYAFKLCVFKVMHCNAYYYTANVV